MTVNVYRSSDASAPTLTGQPGAVVAIFDACLVNGYGSKAAAGWDKPYSAANVGVYRAGTGNRMYLRVDDTAAQEARIQGYETMSSVSAGTGPFPTSGQLNGGPFVRKSETADATTRSWVLVATDKLFYFLPISNVANWLIPTAVDYMSGWMKFGEFTSYKAGDAYNTVISGGSQTSSGYGYFGHNAQLDARHPDQGRHEDREEGAEPDQEHIAGEARQEDDGQRDPRNGRDEAKGLDGGPRPDVERLVEAHEEPERHPACHSQRQSRAQALEAPADVGEQ